MVNADDSVYVSKPTKKSMRNEYSIYPDRIVLKCRFPFLSRTFVLRREDIVSIRSERPFHVRLTLNVLKLDLADLFQHVALERRTGFFKHLRFTPENPEEFVQRAKEALGLS